MQKHVNLVNLVKSFPTNIFLQNLASIQKRTNPIKCAHLAEKSEKGSISNLSTKVEASGAEEEQNKHEIEKRSKLLAAETGKLTELATAVNNFGAQLESRRG